MKPATSYELSIAILATAEAILRESQRLFRPLGLTTAQYNVLNVLSDQPAGLSQRELGERLLVDRSNVTGLLDRMEKNGSVRRTDHPEDRRVYQITLTAAGQALWSEAHPLHLRSMSAVTRGLTERRMKDAITVLNQLTARAHAWTADHPAEKATP